MPWLSCSKGYTLPVPGDVRQSWRTGSGVGLQTSPVVSSRRKIASPAGSEIGSFDQGVNGSPAVAGPREPEPDSET